MIEFLKNIPYEDVEPYLFLGSFLAMVLSGVHK